MSKLKLACLVLLFQCGCAAKAPELRDFKAHDFPVFAPSRVESAMGGQSGESIDDPNASHHMTYWLRTSSKPDLVANWYREKLKALPGAKDTTKDSELKDTLLQIHSEALSHKDQVESYDVRVSNESQNGETEFTVTETLKPGLKY